MCTDARGRWCLVIALAAGLWVAPSTALAQVSLGSPSGVPAGDAPSRVAVGDFNADADPDLAVVLPSVDRVAVLFGGAGASFSAPTLYPATSAPADVAVGDFNADADPDVAVAGFNGVALLLGAAGGAFSESPLVPIARPPRAIAVGDFNGDADPDLALANGVANNVSVLLGGLGATFSAPIDFALGGPPVAVAVGDFNGDADPDLAVANFSTDNVSVLLGGPGATFSAPTNFAAGNFPQAVAVGDFNGDGDPDLAVANQLSSNVSVLLGGPDGSFSGAANFAAGASPFGIEVGDLNGDGDLDLAIANRDSDTVSVLLGGPDGSFSAPTAVPVGDAPVDVAVADFDADSRPDLAATNSSALSRDISVLTNTTGQTPPDPPVQPTALPALVALAADRDADTVPDAGDNCVDTPNPPQADRDADGVGDACDASDASVGPTVGKTAIARVVSGEVFIRLPAGAGPRGAARAAQAPGAPSGFIALKGAEVLPVGSVVHTVRGRVSLTSAAARTGGRARTQRAEFYDGIFQLRQRVAQRPVTDLRLQSPGFAAACGAAPRTASGFAAKRKSSKKVVSRLWADGKGTFRTTGRHSAATVRGTRWLTQERCDGTLTRVTSGVVSVRDQTLKRTVTVRAGRSYLARAVRATVKARRP